MTHAILQKSNSIKDRSEKLFEGHRQSLFRRTDRLFAILLVCQWVAGIAIALVMSPRTWMGEQSAIHIHVLAALFLGGAITACPVYLAWQRPGEIVTRHVIAVSQMLFSALLIHLTGGRIETHFHVFGSLAFLAVYNDWRVLITASIVVVVDHVLRGIFWPQSVYGVLSIEPWRWIEHAWWVVFEDLFLIKACLNNVKETHNVAQRQAEVEDTKQRVEEVVKERTKELQISERILATQYSVNRVLAESSSLAECSPQILRAIATNMMKDLGGEAGTIYGEMWQASNDGLLRRTCNIQLSNSSRVEPFLGCDFIQFAPGIGLPGRVLSTKGVVQITDIAKDDNFPRREIALKAGLRAAFGFPVMEGNEVKVVISFVTDSQRAMTTDEFAMLESLGQQVGQFIVRKRIERDNIQLANIVNSSNDAIIGQTPEGTITTWNRGAERMFGYAADQAIGRNVAMLVPDDRLNEIADVVVKGELMENFETVWIGKDQIRKDVSIANSPIVESNAKVIGISVIARDISERKLAEKRVSEFYSTVSHELRTPLTSIRGALGLIGGGVIEAGSTEAMDLIEIAKASSDRLIRLINDILDLKKIEVGKFELAIESLDPAELVENALAALTGMGEQEGIKLGYKRQCNDRFLGDKDRCTQVLTNLVSNAIKFSPAGSSVTVSIENGAPGMVRFLVSDTGPGIDPEKMNKLFDKFQQLDSSDTRAKGGTGLGLAIAKAIVEEHSGKIGLNSTVGEGTTFWFELPAERVIDAELAADDNSDQFSVLIVELNDQLAQVLGIHISSEGFKVSRASSLLEAQLKLARSSPAVIVLDVCLPDGSGLDLLELLNNDPERCSIPVVVITEGGAEEGCSYSPMIVDWLIKPFETQQLLRSIERALSLPSRKKVSCCQNEANTGKLLLDQSRGPECVEARDFNEVTS